MKYFELGKEVIVGRVVGAVRFNDRKDAESNSNRIIDSIQLINRLKDIIDDSMTVVNTPGGTIMSARSLLELELPSMFKPLVMPRSIRFALDALPKHPDLKDYTVLGGAKDQIDLDLGKLVQATHELRAALGRNAYRMSTFKVGDVWCDRTLSDALCNVTVQGKDKKVESRLCDLTQPSISQIPCPVTSISAVINLFNFISNVEQWAEVFKFTYQLPMSNEKKSN